MTARRTSVPPEPVHPARAPLQAALGKVQVIAGTLETQLATPSPLSRADVLAWQRHLVSAINELAPASGFSAAMSRDPAEDATT